MGEPYFLFYQIAMLLSLLASLIVIALTWRYRKAHGAGAMIALAVATFVWALGFLLEANSDTLERQLFFNNIGYLGSMSVPVAWFVFALHYTNGNRLLAGWKVAPFCIIPLVTVILVWTNNLHHLMWYNEHLITSGPFTVTAKNYGTFFWIALVNNYSLIVAGAIMLVRRLFVGAPLYARQAVSLLTAISLPLLWNIIFIFNLVPLPRKDLTPVMFAISGIAMALGLIRFNLFRAVPFAREFLIQQLSEGIFVFDMRHRLIEANPAALVTIGADRSIIGKNIEYLSQFSPVLKQLPIKESKYTELSLTVSGEERFYDLATMPIHNDHNQQVGWLTVLHNVTERKRQELEYKTIIQTTADGFWLADMQGRFLDVNDAYCKLVGYSRSELLKMRISDIEAIEKQDETIKRIANIKKNGKDRFETRHRHKDGRINDVEVSVNYVEVSGGRMFVFIRDITEHKKLQEQLLAQNQLASIGELTAGVAHELNNPLAGIVGFSELLLKRDLPADIKTDLDIINSEAERAAKIVDHLLTFARRQPADKRPTAINEIISKTLELRAYQQKLDNIRTITHFAPDLPEIMANAFQLRQAFLNIIINAEFFMIEAHGKGTLSIRTEKTGEFVRASFTDDGPGILPENMTRLFSPFFTTKEVGKGTGLGLSICHGIISEHGGRIWAESQYGKGATFTVELPVIKTGNEPGEDNNKQR
ncbi:MAG: histidine kinase N-terminal 7TM domain-containing protein [Dehalococcoidales bacterium]|nr:histidine kinase N-terminal 7TM domain-containing protein [Dehalococcoidales bacterium]